MGRPQQLDSVGEILASAYATTDLSRLRALIEQARHLPFLPAELRDALAECLTGLVGDFRGREDRFVAYVLAVIAEVSRDEVFDVGLFRRHYGPGRAAPGEPLPALFEAAVETARRLRDAWRIEDALAGTGTSGILCGSTSYGPFYNVRSTSDLDFVIVIETAAAAAVVADRLGGLPGVAPASVELLRTRAGLFRDRYDDGRTILSHKIRLWTDRDDSMLVGAGLPGDYPLSLHLITERVLGYALVESSPTLERSTVGGVRTVRAYRDTRTTRPDLPRTFAGRELPVLADLTEAASGWLRSTTACQFDDADCYCPGFLQTILLPLLDLRWDERGCRPRLRAFERKFRDRYLIERARSPHALLRPSFTHVRREVFAPHIIRSFDEGR
ncbi:hypothetical protein [Micromonospora sp. NPDC048898]|uniref:hypothetical protein n=1 Tax=Micromonospora sp. NPDC048898 TaxID=3364260 RepID=UPI003721605F